MADFLDEKRAEIGERLKQLKPLVEEYRRLEAAVTALDGAAPATAPAAPPKRAGARKRATTAKSLNGAGPRGRPKGSGKRGVEALALVTAQPGITIPEIAAQMGIKQNYLYRVLPSLAEEGRVTKDGRGWHPAAPA
jgi:hypothetical protein